MTTLRRSLVCLFWIAVAAPPAGAVIMQHEEMGVEFKDGLAVTSRFRKPEFMESLVSWSDTLAIVDNGMVWRPFLETRSPVGWIQSAPMPVNITWRPPHRVYVKLALRGSTREAGFQPRVFVRHGCDRVHWATWRPMNLEKPESAGAQDEEKPFQLRYTLEVIAPDKARERYLQLMDEWRKTDPDWDCDEEEFCRWLAKEQPAFFLDHFPFVGYLQFLIEDPRWERVRLEGIDLEMDWGVGGLHSPPKRGDGPRDGPWRFTWQPKAASSKQDAKR